MRDRCPVSAGCREEPSSPAVVRAVKHQNILRRWVGAEQALQVCPEASAPGDQPIEKEKTNDKNMVKYKLFALLTVCFNALSYQVSDSRCALCRDVPLVADHFWWWGWQGAPPGLSHRTSDLSGKWTCGAAPVFRGWEPGEADRNSAEMHTCLAVGCSKHQHLSGPLLLQQFGLRWCGTGERLAVLLGCM